MKTISKFLRTSFVTLALSLNADYVLAAITDLNVVDSFKYTTRRTIAVDIHVITKHARPVGLNFYSDGKNGLRLLFSTITDNTGHYQGKLSVPAALKSVVVKSRSLNDFKLIRVAIQKNAITQAIKYK